MEHGKSKYYNILKHAAIVLDVLFIVTLVLNYIDYLPAFFNILYIFYFVLFINTWLLALKIKQISEHERDNNSIVYLSKYFFILSLIIIALNQFLKRAIIIDNMNYIVGFTIALGFLTFYSSREKVEHDIEQEKSHEEQDEERRKEEFEYKFPRINKIPVFRSIVKWMYKEGWWYSGLLIAIVVLGFFFRLYLATKMMLHVDEGYTDLVTRGFFTYGEIGTTPTGIIYPRTMIFNLINSLPYLIIDSHFLQIRLINLTIFTLFIPFSYLIIKNIFHKKVALLFTLFTSLSWYLNATAIVGRSYNIFIILSFLSLYLLYLSYNNLKEYKKFFFYLFLFLFLLILNFFEGHSLSLFHLAPFVLIFFFYFLIKTKKYRFLILALILIFFTLILLYLILIKPDLLRFILYGTYNPLWRWNIIRLLGSFISYINIIGILSVGFLLLLGTLIKNKTIKFLSFYVLLIIIIQGYFFGLRTNDIRHLSDLILPIFLVISYFFAISKNKYKLFFIIIFLGFIFVSVLGLYGLSIGKIGWGLYSPEAWNEDLELIPPDEVIVTDAPQAIIFLRPNSSVYLLKGDSYNREVKDINLTTLDPLEKYSLKEKERFKKFIIHNIYSKYIINPEYQEYFKFSGNPKVMSIEHLRKIINSSKEKKVYLILTQNSYDRVRTSGEGQEELYSFIFKNMEVIKNEKTIKDYFDDQPYPYRRNERLLIASISLHNFNTSQSNT